MTKLKIDSLLSLEEYAKQRPVLRAKAIEEKRLRKVFIGPNVTLQFENEATIRYQVQEMLRIEKTFEQEGIQDELEAYNPLIPDGTNLKCTQLIEFPDPQVRKEKLKLLKGIERHTYIQVYGFDRAYAIADEDMERENDEKTSAVHFMRFELTPEMIKAFKGGEAIAVGIDLPAYNHRVGEVDPSTQASLMRDLR